MSGGAAMRAQALEALQALAKLEAERLEELLAACAELQRDSQAWTPQQWQTLASEEAQCAGALRTLAFTLEATSLNLAVLANLREQRLGRLEYIARAAHK